MNKAKYGIGFWMLKKGIWVQNIVEAISETGKEKRIGETR